jgi:hypothetical protein
MEIEQLGQWWNLVYVIPFGFGFVFLAMQVMGLELGHGGDIDHDFHGSDYDATVESGADADVEAGTDHSVGLSIDHIHDHELTHVPVGPVGTLLSIMGFGKVPLSLILMNFSFTWGTIGWSMNVFLEPIFKMPGLFEPISLLAAGVGSVTITSGISRLMAKYAPRSTNFAVSVKDLVGLEAEVDQAIDAQGGSILVRNQHGILTRQQAYAAEEIPAGAIVMLISYDQDNNVFVVASSPQLKQLAKNNQP